MSKNITTLSAIETEAVTHFSLVMRLLGCEGGNYGPLKIFPALNSNERGVKRVKLSTKFNGKEIEGVVVLINEDGQWRLFCAASSIKFSDWHVSFSYDRKTRNTYHINKFYNSGMYELVTVNMVTGEREVFSDPLDAR